MLEWIRQEFEGFVNDAHSLRAQVTDYDAHCALACTQRRDCCRTFARRQLASLGLADSTAQQHSAEMSSLRLTLIDLERQHTKLKERYEEEIAQLKRELENRYVTAPTPS